MPDLHAVNAVLATFLPGHQLERTPRGLWLVSDGRRHRIALRSSDRLWLSSHKRLDFGGTTEQAVCQLVLWVRGLPRRPLLWWRGAVSVGLATPETVQLLERHGYADALTHCVLGCGEKDPRDWWSLGRTVGPCCRGGACRKGAT